jgi:CheY-like chemotaxis protein
MKPEVAASPILVFVDDSPAFSRTILEMLRAKYEVVAAFSDGASALDKIAVLSPDIVILDVSLGDLTGFEVARCLKRSNCPAKIIFLTLHECTDFMNEALDIFSSLGQLQILRRRLIQFSVEGGSSPSFLQMFNSPFETISLIRSRVPKDLVLILCERAQEGLRWVNGQDTHVRVCGDPDPEFIIVNR